ncbi:hypothetical protein [Gemmatimonas sp.]|uniref:hypothetical protein n=1 Tax=Gemmatimonas sp. TaxID=1962908 RepID=UPI003341679D
MTIRSRYQHSLAIVRAVMKDVPRGTSRAACEAKLFPHYPYGERAHHPYTAWRKAVRTYLDERARGEALGATSSTSLEVVASGGGR